MMLAHFDSFGFLTLPLLLNLRLIAEITHLLRRGEVFIIRMMEA
jgi:hypothetical protein